MCAHSLKVYKGLNQQGFGWLRFPEKMDVVMLIEAYLEGRESCARRGAFHQQISKAKAVEFLMRAHAKRRNQWNFPLPTSEQQKPLTGSFQTADSALTC